jgi:hypothetical protein
VQLEEPVHTFLTQVLGAAQLAPLQGVGVGVLLLERERDGVAEAVATAAPLTFTLAVTV